MVNVSRRGLLGAGAGGSPQRRFFRRRGRQGFGNPDTPPQGAINATNPASVTDPGPQSPTIASPVPGGSVAAGHLYQRVCSSSGHRSTTRRSGTRTAVGRGR